MHFITSNQMGKLSKNRKRVTAKVDSTKVYSVSEASQLVKDISFTKFDSSVDLSIRLGVETLFCILFTSFSMDYA